MYRRVYTLLAMHRRSRRTKSAASAARRLDPLLVVSGAHHRAVRDLAARDRRTMRVITETAIEEYARRHGIEIQSRGAAIQEGAAT